MTQRLKNLLASNQNLRQLSGKLQQVRSIQTAYERIIPPSLLRGSHVLNLEHGILSLSANNAAIAAKLRQMAPELQEQLSLQGCEVTGIQVRVQVALSPAPRHRSPASLGPNGKLQLSQLAASLPDTPLKRALLRLAKGPRVK